MRSLRPKWTLARRRALSLATAALLIAAGAVWAATAIAAGTPESSSEAVHPALEVAEAPAGGGEAAPESPVPASEEPSPTPGPPAGEPSQGEGAPTEGGASEGGPQPPVRETAPPEGTQSTGVPQSPISPESPRASGGETQAGGGDMSAGLPSGPDPGVAPPSTAGTESRLPMLRGIRHQPSTGTARSGAARHARHGAEAAPDAAVVATTVGAPLEGLVPVLPGLQGLAEDAPPAFLLWIYHAAGKRYHVPWAVLAGINQVETNYGRDLSVSSAGAEGWMQFMPGTWSEWGVDADRDGIANPYSPIDAIFTAARYLQASGARTDLRRAIFAYNHASWYVTAVLLRAEMLEHALHANPLQHGYALPLAAGYMHELGRTDDGVDIETPPDGALVYSMTPGEVTAVADDPGGFGPNYPVVRADGGPLMGQYIYYGHVAQSLVRPGEHVSAGQPIAIVGHTGDASTLGHGHIEIGFGDQAGTPLDQHGQDPTTPAGLVMRSFLVELSAGFGIANG
ncbi:MAG TPA: lytic murein transglycosylase [Solirubrobacteraceae bacterium]|nr:lytic murein transglycosylase [Solirubrobacteraceae bacterium]